MLKTEAFRSFQKNLLARIGLSPEAKLLRAERELADVRQRTANYWRFRRQAKAAHRPVTGTLTYRGVQKEVRRRLEERFTSQTAKVAQLKQALA